MYVIDPEGYIVSDPFGGFAGATLRSPERATVSAPMAGRWRVILFGYDVYRRNGRADDPNVLRGRIDEFGIYADVDGRRLRLLPAAVEE